MFTIDIPTFVIFFEFFLLTRCSSCVLVVFLLCSSYFSAYLDKWNLYTYNITRTQLR